MTDFLLITLYAPLASWGDIAVGESRGSWDRPSRSAVLGLVAAALGITRDDQAGHDELDQSLGLAVRQNAAGIPFSDFHTAQTVSQSTVKKHKPETRRALLDAGDRNTIVSRRVLYQDSLHTAALWLRGSDGQSLSAIAEALKNPHFALYAGRRANPFGLPLNPQLISADTLADAFTQYTVLPSKTLFPGLDLDSPMPSYGDRKAGAVWIEGDWLPHIAYDPLPDGVESGFGDIHRTETRRDTAPDRTRWQFDQRKVQIGALPGETER